jgi:hypothetical protein
MYELLNRFHLQATDMRDGIAKFIYANLFDWLVEQINIALEVGKSRTGRSISILDIYGFESFKVSSTHICSRFLLISFLIESCDDDLFILGFRITALNNSV